MLPFTHLDDEAHHQYAQSVQELAARWQLERAIAPWRAHCFQDNPDRRQLHLDDLSGIPFLEGVKGVADYQHRARVRARDGDSYVAVTPQPPGYERYCRDVLGIGAVDFQLAQTEGSPMLIAAACAEEAMLQTLVEWAQDGLTLHPFLSSEATWQLARIISERSGHPVDVLGPPPPITWIANDKALFSDVVARVLGSEQLVETVATRDPERLADALWALTESHRRVALKRTRCASAMGNEVHHSAELRELGRSGTQALVEHFLKRTEWEGDEDVLAVAWEDADLSPSAQLWIPSPTEGKPRLDGLYEQLLTGEEQVFLGSRPAQLSDTLARELAASALAVGAGLQALGYVGRCSFDYLVVGDRVLFTECNGRWGGTSTPMHLLDRIMENRPAYRAQDVLHPSLVGRSFSDLCAALGDDLWSAERQAGRFVLYNPGPLASVGKIDVISMADTPEEAERGINEVLVQRLAL